MGALGGLLQGMVAGRHLRLAMQQAQDQHAQLQQELQQRDQAMQQQQHDAGMKMLTDRMNAEMMGLRPASNGMVEDMLSSPEASGQPAVQPNGDGSVNPLDALRGSPSNIAPPAPPEGYQNPGQGKYLRKADKSRVVTIPWFGGQKLDYEIPTRDEQIARQNQMAEAQQMREKLGAAKADTASKLFVLRARGQKLPDDVAQTLGIDNSNPFSLFTPEEIPTMIQKAQEMKRQNLLKLSPGETLNDVSGLTGGAAAGGPVASGSGGPGVPGQASGGAHVVATGGPPLPTDDFGKYFLPAYAAKAGKKVGELTPDEQIKAFSDFTLSKADPEVRAASLASKQAAIATQNLSQVLKQIQIDQAPKPEDAEMIADDIRNHRLAPDQFTMIRGRGNGGLGVMVERAMKKTDPNFNWEQAAAEYQLAKSPQFQNTVRYMDSVQESLPLVISRAQKLANGNIRGVNALLNAGKNQVNDVDLKKFNTDRLLVADEIAKILQGGGTGGGTSDLKLKQAGEILKASDSPAAIAAALGDVQQLIGFRRKALTRGTYLENAHLDALPQGGGKAIDAQTAAKFYEAAGNDPEKARQLAAQNGWTVK